MTTEQDAASRPKVAFKDITLKPFGRDDLPKLPPLFQEALGRHVTPEWLDWKFFGGPYGQRLGFVVAYHGDELVGFIGANPVPFSIDGERSPVYQHQDTAIREDCRSLQLLRAMIEEAETVDREPDVKLTYSITTPHMRSLVTKRMKYTVVWENLKMVKLTSLRAYASKATRSAKLASFLPGPISRSWKAPASLTGDIRQIDSFGPEFDDFWKVANTPGDDRGRVFPWQDAEWLNYKFCGDGMVTFQKYAYVEAGQVLGYVVLNITKLDVRIGYIDSLWAVPDRPDLIETLADFAIHRLMKDGCDQISCWTRPETPVGRALSEHGFTRRPTPQCLSIKQLQEGMGDLGLKTEHWNLQRGHTYYTSLGHLSTEEGAQRLYKAKEQRDQQRAEQLRTKG